MRLSPRPFLSTAALAVGAASWSGDIEAQTVQSLVNVGDEIFGIGSVTDILTFTVSDNGEWLVLVEAQTGGTFQEVLLRNGIPTVQERDLLASPPGAEVKAMSFPSFSDGHDIGWFLEFYGSATTENSGCFVNTTLLLQESKPSTAPGFSTGTTWKGFTHARINDRRQILCQGTVDDPAITGTSDTALVLLELNSDGSLASEEVLLKEGTSYGGKMPLSALGTKTHTLAFNNSGDFLTFLDTTDSSTKDGNIFLNYTSVAQEGQASPVAGRNWSNLGNPRLDLNDYGEYVLTGTLDGDGTSNLLISKNGEKFIQEGDVIPGIAPFTVSTLHSAPIFISNAGRVFWFSQFSSPDASRNKAIFMDDQPLVRAGVTAVGNQFVRILRTFTESYFVPSEGRYVIFWAKLDDGTIGVHLLDVGTVVPVPGCHGNTATLAYTDGLPLLGNQLEFEMDHAQGLGVTPVFLLSTLPVTGWPPCGLDTGLAGELLIDISAAQGNPAYFALESPWSGVPVKHRLVIPDDAALAGIEFYAQGLFWDIGDLLPEQNLQLTNGVKVVIATL